MEAMCTAALNKNFVADCSLNAAMAEWLAYLGQERKSDTLASMKDYHWVLASLCSVSMLRRQQGRNEGSSYVRFLSRYSQISWADKHFLSSTFPYSRVYSLVDMEQLLLFFSSRNTDSTVSAVPKTAQKPILVH